MFGKKMFLLLCLIGLTAIASAQLQVNTLPPDLAQKIDQVAEQVLEQTGVPSASVAIVRNGQIAYTRAYGKAQFDPRRGGDAGDALLHRLHLEAVHRGGDSVSRTRGKLSLDDKVSKYLPDLTRADEITIRMLLSHTSGYQDYWPEDYLMPPMSEPTTAQHIFDAWGKKPLDFDPGTKWQYSNTNFVIAGRIVEMASGEPLMRFLEEHIFHPLEMKEVWNSDLTKLGDTDAKGYIRFALGPLRPAPKEGAGLDVCRRRTGHAGL